MDSFVKDAVFKLRMIPSTDAPPQVQEELEVAYTVVEGLETLMVFRFKQTIPQEKAQSIVDQTKAIFAGNKCVFLPSFIEMIALEPANEGAEHLLFPDNTWQIVHVSKSPRGLVVRNRDWRYGVVTDLTQEYLEAAYRRVMQEKDTTAAFRYTEKIRFVSFYDLIERFHYEKD